MLYRVTHQVSDYILLILIWECLHAKPILPDLHNSARFAAVQAELCRHQNYQIKVNKM